MEPHVLQTPRLRLGQRAPRLGGAWWLMVGLLAALPVQAESPKRGEAPAIVEGTSLAAPPVYPDAAHVPEGCYLSAFRYLAKFGQAYPAERGMMLTVAWPSVGGLHTLAVVSWRGRWWARDEYGGVFDLRCAVAEIADPTLLRKQAEEALKRLTVRQWRFARQDRPDSGTGELSLTKRREAVAAAADLLPCPSQCFLLRQGRTEIPVLFFQPSAGLVAVYDPSAGTAVAESKATHPARIVALMAAQLGYEDGVIRPGESHFAAALVER